MRSAASGLDQEAKLGDLGHGLLAYLGHERAAVRGADDQPLLLQPREGLARRGLADPELGGQASLAQ